MRAPMFLFTDPRILSALATLRALTPLFLL